MCFLDLQDARVGEMVIVAVADDDYVDLGYVGQMTGSFCVSFWAHPANGRASVFEDRVEQYSETAGEFDVVAGMA